MDWVHKEYCIDTSGITNVVIAAYATAQARVKFYQYLERLDRRTLYADCRYGLDYSYGCTNRMGT